MPIREPKRSKTQILFPGQKTKDFGPGYRKAEELGRELLKKAYALTGLRGQLPLEALILLGYSKPDAMQKLKEIFIEQKKEEHIAEALAEQQVNTQWDRLKASLEIQLKYSQKRARKEAEKIEQEIINRAIEKGFKPENIVEALIDLDYPPIELILELRRIHLIARESPEAALTLAKNQYLESRFRAIERKNKQLKKRKS